MRIDTFPIVEVEWLDSHGGDIWNAISLNEDGGIKVDHDDLRCYSVGWLVHKCARCISVVPHFAPGKPEQGGDITIPRAAVTKIRTLKKRGEAKMPKKKKKLPKKPRARRRVKRADPRQMKMPETPPEER